MPPIRRAAVTGLFALWLAPLPALDGSQPTGATTDFSSAAARVEAVAVDDRERRRAWALERRAGEPRPGTAEDEP